MKTIRTMVAAAVLVVLGGATGCAGSVIDSSGADCHAVCDRAGALTCQDADVVQCKTQCDKHGGFAKCTSQFDAFASCLGGITLKCNAEGEVDTSACETSQTAYIACASQEPD